MGRWEPDACGRLEEAAMELYRERGFDQTTVADIAARAGLTERTFFRYFADKREVLFQGSARLKELLVGSVIGAPKSTDPLEAVASAFEATAPFFEGRREYARQRQALIVGHADLQERELIKLASLASASGEALRRRGVPATAASFAAEMGVAIFKIAFEHWLADSKKRDLAHHVRESLRELRAVTTASRSRAPKRPRRVAGATRTARRRRPS
jgi:AcrR family transcriptional regulator